MKTISLDEITGDNSVHFPVESFSPNPISSTTDPLVLTLRFGNGRRQHQGMTPYWVTGTQDALWDAIHSGETYWIDQIEPDAPLNTANPCDNNLQRTLEAIRNRQIVPTDEVES